ncbi:MAG: transposase [Lewinellaceae bacterium]|nr:transposase [Lewinellaceae bacterium]
MKNNHSFFVFLLLVASACGGKKETAAEDQSARPATPQQAMEQAMEQAERTIQQTTELQQPVEPVNFRELKELLPEKAAGFTRTNAAGETAGAMNIKISKAEGDYKDDSGKELRLLIMDTGGLGISLMSMAAWSSVTVDKEDDKGYERTTTFKGYKCFEKFRKNGESSELALLAEGRFVITATCRGCSMETLRSVVGAVQLSKLKNIR